ncbi:MAG: flagellar basal body L-ring protein FlgH, partial [Paracoccaceae bacterium]
MHKYIIIFGLILGGCGTYIEDRKSIDYAPIYETETVSESEAGFGSIYKPKQGSLFAMEGRASRVGDILTVAFTESFQATKSQNAATSRSSESSVTFPPVVEKLIPGEEFASSGENTFSGSGSTAQSNSLTGSVSVHVIRVFGNGNLEIMGQKKLTLNNGDEYIRVSGIVRPR